MERDLGKSGISIQMHTNTYSLPDPPDRDNKHEIFSANDAQTVRSSSTKAFMAKYESLDYTFDGTKAHAEVEEYKRESCFFKLFRSALKWFLCLLLGSLVAITAFSVNFGVENIADFKFWLTLKVMNRSSVFASYLIYTLFNCTLVFLSSFIVVYYAPAAAGSGIPDVKGYLNGVNLPNVLHFKTLIAKVSGSVGAVSASLAVGKEGPFVHTGACIASLLTQGQKVNHHLSHWIFNVFSNDSDLRDFVTCGAAAGVAAAFRAPVGGVLFALEEVTSWWHNYILWLSFFTAAIVSIVLRATIRYCSESKCGFFGSGGFILFNIVEGQDSYEMFELVPMFLLGVLGGLFGSAFNMLNAKLTIWRQKFYKNRRLRVKVIEAVLVAFLTSTIAFCLPLTVSCVPCPEGSSERDSDRCPREDNLHSGNYIPFNCAADNEHNDMATLFFNTQDDAIRSLLSSNNNHEYSVRSLIVYFIFFYFLAILTYGVSIPSGLFVPCILCGASYGRLVGMFVTGTHPHHNIDEGTYALLGAAGFLGGATRMTVSLCVILLELTNNLALLPLVMLVLLVAKGIGDNSGVKAIYDLHVDLKGIPFLDPQPEHFMEHLTAKDTAASPVITFNRIERVGRIKDVLKNTSHNGFPIIGVDNKNIGEKVLGTVLRSTLIRLFGGDIGLTDDINDTSSSKTSNDIVRLTIISSSTSTDNHTVDLLPLCNHSLNIVDENLPASDAYTMFRQLGLRHMYVVRRIDKVIGIVTRKDLLPDKLELKFSSKDSELEEALFDEVEDDNDDGGGADSTGSLNETGSNTILRRLRKNENENNFNKGY